jgi:Uma2 family endonuclease
MARPAPNDLDEETIQVPRAVRFPVELTPPQGFDAERLETWPRVEGRLEWVDGRLLYMPPCGELQAHTVTDLVTILGNWVRSHREFVVGTNEAGMLLRGAARIPDRARGARADRLGGEPPSDGRAAASACARTGPGPSRRRHLPTDIRTLRA